MGGRAAVGGDGGLELSPHSPDVLENAIDAGTTWVELRIEEYLEADRLIIEVVDKRTGMGKVI